MRHAVSLNRDLYVADAALDRVLDQWVYVTRSQKPSPTSQDSADAFYYVEFRLVLESSAGVLLECELIRTRGFLYY